MIKLTAKICPLLVAFFVFMQFSFIETGEADFHPSSPGINSDNLLQDKYALLNLSAAGLSKEAFDNAIKGFTYLHNEGKLNSDSVISVIDFSLASTQKRLFVIDLKNNKLLYNSLVAHGRNSGKDTAEHFSNAPESFESSLGFYVTAETYKGKHGYSLKLVGQESGINDNAYTRGIVIHCAAYVSESYAHRQGYIGRSEGCPALPENMYRPIIERIKNGSCLYIYSSDKNYSSQSRIINDLKASA
jgi:hypothetical protein